MKKALGWLVLVLTLAFAVVRSRPPQVQSLAPAKTRLFWVGDRAWQELAHAGKGAWGVLPVRAGRQGENWTLLDVFTATSN